MLAFEHCADNNLDGPFPLGQEDTTSWFPKTISNLESSDHSTLFHHCQSVVISFTDWWWFVMQYRQRDKSSRAFNVGFQPCRLHAEISPDSRNILMILLTVDYEINFLMSLQSYLGNIVLELFAHAVVHKVVHSIEYKLKSFSKHCILSLFTFYTMSQLHWKLIGTIVYLLCTYSVLNVSDNVQTKTNQWFTSR